MRDLLESLDQISEGVFDKFSKKEPIDTHELNIRSVDVEHLKDVTMIRSPKKDKDGFGRYIICYKDRYGGYSAAWADDWLNDHSHGDTKQKAIARRIKDIV